MNIAQAGFSRSEIIGLVVKISFVTTIGYLGLRWLVKQIDPTTAGKKQAKKKAEEQLRKIAESNSLKVNINTDQLSEHEMMIASHLVNPSDITVSWESIAGLEKLIQELKETIVLPIQRRDLFGNSQLTQAPKGVLLHGPPGCGKTMIAKATAKESNTRFINLDVSILTDKWYGESQKLTSAVFSLAAKLQPCIIFIDEIDSLLRSRNSTDHEATAMMKAQFMSLWDGLITNPSCTVIIMGATNRPQDLDKAILRRMPATFFVGLPNELQRAQVLQLMLRNEPVDDNLQISRLAQMTEGFSNSDLHELCRNASVYRVRDYLRTHAQTSSSNGIPDAEEEEFHDTMRPITMTDLVTSANKMRMSKIQTNNPMMKLDLD